MTIFNHVFSNQLTLLFVILTLGCLAGKMKVFGITVSASGGVLFVAMAFGHFQYTVSEDIGSLGFALFIYAIGFSAGPRFFHAFRKNGLRYIMVAVFVAISASFIAVVSTILFNLQPIMLPGILAGSLTSTSTLAAAYEVTKDPLISVSYGITYPFGLIGLLVLIQSVPRWMRIDLKTEARGVNISEDELEELDNSSLMLRRVYVVRNSEFTDRRLRDLDLPNRFGVLILSITRKKRLLRPSANRMLRHGDHILVEGTLENLLKLTEVLGPEINDAALMKFRDSTARVVINKKSAADKTLRELSLAKDLGVMVTRVQSSGMDLVVHPELKLERHDTVTLAGKESMLQHAMAFLGRQEHKIYETDIFTFCAGLVMGLILGTVKIPFVDASLGNAGGLLFMGILLGYLRNFGPFSGRVPMASRYILQELGMLLFLASVGTHAGTEIMTYLFSQGLSIFIAGVLVTTGTLMATLILCHHFLKFDWNTSFGATTGGVTSTVALQLITKSAESQYAVIGYAGVYAFANILLTILGQVILIFA
ncbi:hypothetical protein JW979_09715 [bacterium]|nr:hypothetical protein [candidate division CSSED10-310 bacterium]